MPTINVDTHVIPLTLSHRQYYLINEFIFLTDIPHRKLLFLTSRSYNVRWGLPISTLNPLISHTTWRGRTREMEKKKKKEGAYQFLWWVDGEAVNNLWTASEIQ